MKKLIVSDASLSRMKGRKLKSASYGQLCLMGTRAQPRQFNFILRVPVAGIALTFSVDTSGCERLISLMNNLKTKFQEKNGTRDPARFGLVVQVPTSAQAS